MKLIWTKSDLILSRGIRWLFNEPVSHFAIVFNEASGCGVVFQSNLLGTNIKWLKTFEAHCQTMYSMEYNLAAEEENKIWKAIVDKYDSKPYDFGAFFWLLWRGLLHKFFNIPIPIFNPWESNGAFLCDELYETLNTSIEGNLFPGVGKPLAVMTPYKLYETIKRRVAS